MNTDGDKSVFYFVQRSEGLVLWLRNSSFSNLWVFTRVYLCESVVPN